MITVSDAARSVLAYSHNMHISVSSWRDGVLLADDVPVDEGTAAGEETDAASNVPERITLSVPRYDRGVRWDPRGDDHPLAAAGQRLSIKLGVGLEGSDVEWLQRGTFLIQEAEPVGDVVNVTAVGMLALIFEADLISPFQPAGTMASALRGLVEPALTVAVSPSLTDRAVPGGVVYDDQRMAAVQELLTAWAARGRVDPFGVLQVLPSALDPTPVLSLTDGAGGTVITARARSARTGAASLVVARGTASDGRQIQGVAYDTSDGPWRYGGPANPLPVPAFFFSPLLSTVGECEAAALTVLTRRRRAAGREFRVDMIPDPTVQVDDVWSLDVDGETVVGSVERIDNLPYVATGALQTCTVREL
jgi:hypothetical protein